MRVQPGESVRMAMQAVWSHRIRSSLTILGIVIGITTVVAVASLLTGLQKGVVTFFEEFGPDNIFVARFGGDPAQRPKQAELRRRPLQLNSVEAVKRLAPSVADVGVQLFIPSILGRQPLVAKVPGYESDRVGMAAYSANFFDIAPRELRAGRVFTAEEDTRADKVCVLGPSLADALFPDGNALGKSVNVGGAEYAVRGVFAPAKGGFFGENALDYQMAVPFQTARQRFPQLDNFFFTIHAKEGQRTQAFEESRAILRKVRRVPTDAPDDFSITTPDQIIKSFEQITNAVLL
ncbi:MAG: ABC transporter permease, partial [Candidatus Solibacter usitatus]|nr:ABC transporter permease [Candidatus Solibacter usitatus]